MIVAKNPSSVKRASSYSERLHLPLAVIHGEEKVAEQDTDDGRTSPPLHDTDSTELLTERITSIDVADIPGIMGVCKVKPLYGDVCVLSQYVQIL